MALYEKIKTAAVKLGQWFEEEPSVAPNFDKFARATLKNLEEGRFEDSIIKGANSENAIACHYLGVMYRDGGYKNKDGQSIPKDVVKAAAAFSFAAEKGIESSAKECAKLKEKMTLEQIHSVVAMTENGTWKLAFK